jgi:hypothetical protein
MTRGMVKLVAAGAAGAAVLAGLVALTHRARAEGRRSYCRNNLRHLGQEAYSVYAAGWEFQRPEARGRAFWQGYREFVYRTRDGRWIRRGQLNPFGCPVRGAAPANFDLLDDPAFAAYMADASTIDYLGPAELPEKPGTVLLGADRPGNHPGGGYVLTVDFAVGKVPDSAEVGEDWTRARTLRD